LGWDSLADIALPPGDSLWWADAGTAFGSFNLATYQGQTWFVDDLNPGGEPLNLGPLVYQGGKPWLASWYGPKFGLFSFDPPTQELCLYAFPSGLFATDLAVHGGLLWALDWRSPSKDSLFSIDPATGRLVKYDTGRDVQMFANLVSDGALFWWAEDKLNSAVVRFNPATGQMTVFNLPTGTYPRNLSLRGGKVWFTDKTGKYGWLDPNTAAGTTSTLSGQVLSEGITPDCVILGASNIFEVLPEPGNFSWSNVDSTLSEPISGVGVYTLPAGAEPFGIAGTLDFMWISDPGRQKLVRMPLEAPPLGTITLVKQVTNASGGTAAPDDFNLTLDGAPVLSGVAVQVEPGTYRAGETLLAGYTFDGFSGGCNENGDITIALGESKTCTLTNDDIPPRLTVIKQVINAYGGTAAPGDFTLTVTGVNVQPSASFPGSAGGTTVTLRAGAFSVSETGPAGYTAQYSANCSGTIAVGDQRTCTVTNTQLDPEAAYITLVKVVNVGTAAPDDFNLTLDGEPVLSGEWVKVEPGTYTAGETLLDNYTFDGFSGACSASGEITVAQGQSLTCTLTNTYQPEPEGFSIFLPLVIR